MLGPATVVGLFSPFIFHLCLSQISLHTVDPPILAVVFLVFWNLLVSLSRLFSVVYHLSFGPCVTRLCSILPIIQALVPTSSRRSFILRLSTLLTPAIFRIQLF